MAGVLGAALLLEATATAQPAKKAAPPTAPTKAAAPAPVIPASASAPDDQDAVARQNEARRYFE